MWKKKRFIGRLGAASITVMMLATIFTSNGAYAETELNWIEGTGQSVTLGDDLAELKLSEDFVFLNGADTQTFQQESGGVPSGMEIGMVFPMDDAQNWAVMFEYEDSGHISDKEKNDIDADALLESYIKGTEESNKNRDEANHMFVDGWETPPKYDEKLRSLTWSLIGHDAYDEQIINYNVRILTREGNVSAVLISDPAELTQSKQIMEDQILTAFTLKDGQRYEDFDPKVDKKAEYGLTALIVGGAGLAVAKKVGLIGALVLIIRKFWVVIIAALGVVWRFITGKKKKKQELQSNLTQDPPVGGTAPGNQDPYAPAAPNSGQGQPPQTPPAPPAD
ncbi:DUF2167 domain-containing protein [Paenibacillus vini]|uniref:DUF2167 domain-containing protein n=1 Tax=Paenibacillus vini TaxID=1476024 RepID=UPI0025B69BD9|nr:DUF2167 domain-containing protein [Paenibacillus vini]MDN4067450.1 DUF2167 domain-containing protein [Paenibacillus vini]